MPETEAMIGYGSTLEVSTDGGSNWTTLAEIVSMTPPADSIGFVEATHMQSPDRTREFLETLSDPGEFSFEMNFIPASDSDVAIRALKGLGAVDWRMTFPSGAIWQFKGIRTTYEAAAPLEDKLTATVGVKVTGTNAPAAPSAPVNEFLPAISGTAQEGETLHVWPGQWSGGPTFTYQWNLDGTPIVDATGPSYLVLNGDIGDPISVTVTATNAAGNASATSADTADVIAE